MAGFLRPSQQMKMDNKETTEPLHEGIIEQFTAMQENIDNSSPISEISLNAEKILKHLRDNDISSDVGRALCYSVKCMLDSAQTIVNEDGKSWDNIANKQFSQRAAIVMYFTRNVLQLPHLSGKQLLKQFLRICLSRIIIMCATHDTLMQWTSEYSIKESKDLQLVLCNACTEPSIRHLLTYESPLETPDKDRILPQEMFSQVLKILQPKLTKSTWKKEPICQHVYKWCLIQMMHPHLGQHLDIVLPSALLFTDDYQVPNKIIGIECLCHIIKEVDATELKWHNRAGVIYSAVHSQIYSNKAHLLDVVIPCMLSILGVIEKSPIRDNCVRNVNRYDEILQLLLANMESEQVIVLRRLYLKYVPLFVDKMGVTILRHIKILLRIISSYLEVSDGQEEKGRLATLQLTNKLVQVIGSRLTRHTNVLLKALLRLLYDSCLQGFNESNAVTKEIQNSVVKTIRNLQVCCYDSVNRDLKQVVESEVKSIPQFVECVNQIVCT
ncbi:TELO2-interacting protein 2-like isoform X2 [Antedon mediterranea]|uniref:TELO2-interacting protein 2-like isoform X2 n=1 Tax=Antedon mediterranea TaxID=105859 RepID=UPI003AF7F804